MTSTGIGWDAGPTLADRFRRWAGDSRRVYPYAVRAMADDWEAGGPVRAVCAGYENAPNGAVIQLRLLAGVFRLVLTGRADGLRPYYRCLGGTADPSGIWPALRTVIAAHVPELNEALRVAPQTNEVGRCAGLLVGLFDLVGASGCSRIRLLELGASGGLNLLLDRYSIRGPGLEYGPPDSPLRLDDAVEGDLVAAGAPPVPFTVVERRGCDPEPIDPATPDGRLRLRSFVWPDDVHRFKRLSDALAVVEQAREAGQAPVVDAASAATWLRDRLAAPTDPDVLTVVWNSITEQYWPPAEVAAVGDLLADVGAAVPLARVSMEFRHHEDPGPPELRTVWWRGDGTPPRERLVGHVHHHGIPVILDA